MLADNPPPLGNAYQPLMTRVTEYPCACRGLGRVCTGLLVVRLKVARHFFVLDVFGGRKVKIMKTVFDSGLFLWMRIFPGIRAFDIQRW